MKNNPLLTSIFGAFIVVICFFMPWVQLDCGEKQDFSGAQLGGELWLIPIAAVIFIITFFVLYTKNDRRVSITGLTTSIISLLLLLLKYAIFMSSKDELGIRKDMHFRFGVTGTIIGLVMVIVGAVLYLMKPKNIAAVSSGDLISGLERLGKLKEDKLITEEEFESQKQLLLNSPGNTNNTLTSYSSGNQFDIEKHTQNFKNWFIKNKKSVNIGFSFIIVFGLLYYFVLRDDPTRDGGRVAEKLCDCVKDRNKEEKNVYEKFSESFLSSNFTDRKQARDNLKALRSAYFDQENKCRELAYQKYDKLRGLYLTDAKKLAMFDSAYNRQNSKCGYITLSNENSAIKNRIKEKINTLKEVYPNDEKIKSDLLGNKIISWNFDNLAEFQTFEIKKTTQLLDAVEFKVVTVLKNSDGGLREAGLLINYILSDDEWYFQSVNPEYIAFDNLIPFDSWKTIIPLANCTINIADDKKISLKTSDYSDETLLGPDTNTKSFPSSNKYLLKSREDKDVTVRFTYRPIKK